jgi:hypothetical protein
MDGSEDTQVIVEALTEPVPGNDKAPVTWDKSGFKPWMILSVKAALSAATFAISGFKVSAKTTIENVLVAVAPPFVKVAVSVTNSFAEP